MAAIAGKSGLTAASVARAKDKPYKLSDRDGLYLLVKPSGTRYWRMNYRFHQTQRTITFGRYPEILFANARERLLQARRLLADGIDPVDQAKLNKMADSVAASNSFKAVSDEWLEKVRLEDRAAASIKKYEWQLSLVMPAIGRRPISKISAHEVLLALKKIERTKKFYTATSVRTTCSQVFRFAIAIIQEIEHDAAYSLYLFPSLRSVNRPMSDNTIDAALRRMGYSKDEMTAHGFRAMAATLLNEMGLWNADAIERQLAHVERNAVRRAYMRGQYWDERVCMMQHWSDYLDQLRDGAKVLRPTFKQTARG